MFKTRLLHVLYLRSLGEWSTIGKTTTGMNFNLELYYYVSS
jgi:hypothetical protein